MFTRRKMKRQRDRERKRVCVCVFVLVAFFDYNFDFVSSSKTSKIYFIVIVCRRPTSTSYVHNLLGPLDFP